MQKYDITNNLKLRGNPKLVINGKELTVHADARSVFQMMKVVKEKGEVYGTLEAVDILFSKADRRKLDDMDLQVEDFIQVVRAAVSLAMGEDPDVAADPE